MAQTDEAEVEVTGSEDEGGEEVIIEESPWRDRSGEPIELDTATAALRVCLPVKGGKARVYVRDPARDDGGPLLLHPDEDPTERCPTGEYVALQVDGHGRAIPRAPMVYLHIPALASERAAEPRPVGLEQSHGAAVAATAQALDRAMACVERLVDHVGKLVSRKLEMPEPPIININMPEGPTPTDAPGGGLIEVLKAAGVAPEVLAAFAARQQQAK